MISEWEPCSRVNRRRGNDVVVYDNQSRQLSVCDASEQGLELAECPYCRRPLRDDLHGRDSSDEQHGRPGSGGGFSERPMVDPDYFQMLAASRRPSPAGSVGPSTPQRHPVPPALRSGRSRDVSGSHEPPTGAEFVGSVPSAQAGQGISKSAFSPGYFKQFFIEIGELGRGGNGVVLLVEHIMDRVSLGQFACKRVPVGDDHKWLEKVLVEVRLLQKIPHKNLVAYHWVWLEDYQPSRFGPHIPCIWILQEYCNGGDLHSYVLGPQKDEQETKEMLKERARRKSRADSFSSMPDDLRGPSKLTFDDIFSFFRDIASGLHHLHSKGYVHRDLKPSNCLLQRDGNRTRVLISDFGEVQEAVAKRASTGATGTISYCAPEVLRQDGSRGGFGEFTTKSDIFSLGMIVYFMCFGRLPYNNADDVNEENEDLDELRAEITKWPGFDDELRSRPDLPEKLYKYLKRLLSVDPNERPSSDEILASIKGGAGLADIASNFVEENSSRVSAIDSPRQGVSPRPQNRKPQQIRPGLSQLSRHISSDTVRPTSPIRRHSGSGKHPNSRTKSRPTSPVDGSLMKLPKHVEITPPSPEEGKQSPRLMLPPPPERPPTLRQKISRFSQRPHALTAFRLFMFAAKLLLLMVPCAPYAANAWILYPLLALAALDLGYLKLGYANEILLSSVHTGIMSIAVRRKALCATYVVDEKRLYSLIKEELHNAIMNPAAEG